VSLNLRETFREEVRAARAQLAGGTADHDTAIHEARRCIKRARSALKLVRSALGERYARENARLRRIAGGLTAFRDAAAMIETFDELGCKGFQSVRAGLLGMKKEVESAADVAEAMRKAAKALTPGGEWPEDAASADAIKQGFRTAWQQGKKALRRVRRDPLPENFHDLRKRVKTYRFQLRFTGVDDKRLNALDNWLGEAHNLTVLDQRIAEKPARFGREAPVAEFLRLIRERRELLEKRALTAGRKLYGGKPLRPGRAKSKPASR